MTRRGWLLLPSATAALALLVMPYARAQTESAGSPGEHLGGYRAQAAAQAFSLRPVFPGLLPTGDAPIEVTAALTTATAGSGGNAFGQASVLWPGSAAANLGPLIGTGAGQPFIGSLVPPYPLVAEASATDGEVVKGAPPALFMRASGAPEGSEGETRIADIELPGLVRVDELASESGVAVTDIDVTTRSRVTLEGVSILDGAITAEVIRSTSATRSDGTAAASDGDVDVVGLRIGGIEVSVTAEGIEVTGAPEQAEEAPGAGGEPFPGQSPEDQVNQVLEAFDASVQLTRGTGRAEGGSADRVSTGLLVSIANPLGGSGVPGANVPIPPGRFDILLAATSSTTLATPAFEVDLPEFDESVGGTGFTSPGATGGFTDVAAVGSGGLRGSSGNGAIPSPGGGPAIGGAAPTEQRFAPASRAVDYAFAGVPAWLFVAMLGVTGFGSRYVLRFMTRLIATGE